MKPEQLEKYSAAITLSDMEIFVFPELMYSLVLANIMSPVIWRWREQDWAKKLENKNTQRKLTRLRQYIMDEYEFNLDLETWGLTSKAKEMDRFSSYISAEHIAKSNALFGYHGDKYYFDVDIRRHFGLDKYDNNVIPYWKTETVEAMDAFSLKDGYQAGAGECVSLAALYVAAIVIICRIPLEDIYMILTPLHSQNFIDVNNGILTNNRRLVTKTMWFNGSEISNKAQRALRNEKVTILAHSSGYTHCIYDKATINKKAFEHLCGKIKKYLNTELNLQVFASFLRSHHQYQEYFQVCRDCHGQAQFIKAETLFHYEHGSNYRIADDTYQKLLADVSEEDFFVYELPGRIRCDKLQEFLQSKKLNLQNPEHRATLRKYVELVIPEAEQFVNELADFIYCQPKLPGLDKNFVKTNSIEFSPEQTREQIIDYLHQIRNENPTADLAFYAYRDMTKCDWRPFVKAAIERNPVSLKKLENLPADEVYNMLSQMPDKSIYEGKRLAQPDEVINYDTGDGLEKAFLLANLLRQKYPQQIIKITVNNNEVCVKGKSGYKFESKKQLQKGITIEPDGRYYVS